MNKWRGGKNVDKECTSHLLITGNGNNVESQANRGTRFAHLDRAVRLACGILATTARTETRSA
jgi:hypothetical protein